MDRNRSEWCHLAPGVSSSGSDVVSKMWFALVSDGAPVCYQLKPTSLSYSKACSFPCYMDVLNKPPKVLACEFLATFSVLPVQAPSSQLVVLVFFCNEYFNFIFYIRCVCLRVLHLRKSLLQYSLGLLFHCISS